MADPLSDQIRAELKQIEQDLAAQKRVLKRSTGNQVVTEAAEQELKALRTRRAVLEGNLKKFQSA